MAKNTCETSLALSIGFLKKYGYLNDWYKNGTCTWTHGWSESKSSIGITACVYGDDPYITLRYTHTSRDGEKSDLNYQVRVTDTPCFFGGKRYWFICPLVKDGVPCQRRVGVLYCAGKYYGCRQCYDLAYHSQQETHSGMWHVFGKCLFNDFDEKEAALRIKYWRGRPTKRYSRLLRKMGRRPSLDALEAATDALTRRSQK
jgi:hypothetical protein